jgi:mRNA-degrading endonuclease YafQ of YafQ-DinJ toxin-antitoxin module
MQIVYSPKFARMYKKLSIEIKRSAVEKEALFRTDPFAPSLKTHKLTGVFEGCYSFSISYSHRIIFEFADDSTVWFLVIGNHDIYK